MSAPSVRKHVAIALVSAAVLLLQIAVTRILSVVLWYHWAFFAISLSMLGMGVPGIWLALTGKRPSLDRALLAAGILLPLGLSAMIRGQHLFGGFAIVFCLACLLPALLSLGTSICLLLLDAEGASVSTMYGADLLGACVGALAVVPLMNTLATPELAACAGFLPLLAHELTSAESRRFTARAAAVALGASIAWGAPYRIEYTKVYREEGALKPMFVRWTPTARLAIFPTIPWSPEGFRWGMGTKGTNAAAPPQYWLEQDASAGTPITRYDGDDTKLDYLFYDVTSTAYQLKKPNTVAIVGGGGGRDILAAHAAGAAQIDAIELNGGIVSAMREQFAGFNGGVYDLPGVNAIVGEGRSVLTRSKGGYDVIQISMIDSWAATAAGAYSLSENNLYTVEAYRLYFQRLAPQGVVSTSRWLAVDYGFEVPRLLLLVRAALVAEGVADPMKHLAVIEAGKVASVLMARSPFTDADLASLKRVSEARGFTISLPSPPEGPVRRTLTSLLDKGIGAFEQQGFSLAPPTDDKPFFFQMLSPFRQPSAEVVNKLGVNAQSVRTLRTLMGVMTVLTLMLFFVPFALRRRAVQNDPDRAATLRIDANFWSGSGYFVAIGLAFMLLEIGWLQRCVLYLGHPSLAATAALGFMLLGAGTGAVLSHKLGLATAGRAGWLLAATCAAVNCGMGPIMSATLGEAAAVRMLLTGALLVPPGMMMGFAFPIGMQAFGEANKAWFWALNGAASVLASVASLALAMEFGYLRVGYLGAGLYLPAWLLLRQRDRGRPLRTALVAACALPLGLVSAAQAFNLYRAFAERLRYPIDLEWMEGGQLLTAQRLMDRKPIYDACGDAFIPFAYPPVHAALLALAGKLFGLGYTMGRTVSICAFSCAAVLLCRESYWIAGRRWRGAFAALVTMGWLGASYNASGSWYDLIRVDSTCMGLLLIGIVLALPPMTAAFRAPTSGARGVMAALALTGAMFSKQSALLFLPWVVVFSVWREWRSGLRLALLLGAMAAGALVAMNLGSHGQFWILVFDVMGKHPLLPDLFKMAFVTLFFFAPFVLLLPLVTAWLGLNRALPPRVAFWVGMALNALVVSLVTSSKVGAYINNIMTATIFLPAATVMVGAAWLDAMPRRSLRRPALAGAACLAFGFLLSAQRFDFDQIVPAPREWARARALVDFVRALPGTVLFPAHSFIPHLVGKETRQFHEQGYVDVVGAGLESLDLTSCLENVDARWLIVNDKTEPHFLQLLEVAYEPRQELPPFVRMVLGKYTRPTRLYERRAGDTFHADRRDRHLLFDFESGNLDGWQRAGRAFEPGVTTADLEYQQPIRGHRGHYVVNTYHPNALDDARGTLTSPPFTLDRTFLGFRAGGGPSPKLRVELTIDGTVVKTLSGTGRGIVEQLTPVVWDVSAWRGRSAQLVVTDDDAGDFGHLLVDAFELFEPAGR
jgi:hypothetical protein